ncbi:MAG: DUF3305 domain-containing protein [Thiohalophilus sp.]|uniref:DUF3305 domain-containing protein n=1 Tax=Thiohalophilus sp. TaxID=3028392 RepID=UPI00286FE66B|nr:DUF3305 domain-containing protein [Thiohalophilus sp.]MDR9436847.1 DUF3305 domain-containing protein [Thiohalophilus sp.]
MNPHADVSYPVSIVMRREYRQYGQWKLPHWNLVALLPQHTGDGSQRRQRLQGEQDEGHLIWSGFWLELFRDGLQSYYQNLMGRQPSLFVLCRDDDDDSDLAPTMISANFADAEAHMETDGLVLSTPLVAPFSNWLAEYVLSQQPALEKQLQDHKHGKKGKRKHV